MANSPSVGRIVHFQQDAESKPRAAIIASVNEDGTIDLAVVAPHGIEQVRSASMGGSEGTIPTPGCWNWPPFVPASK